MCEFSQYRKEAFGSRQNQYECEGKGETVGAHDDRFVSACDWTVSIFLHETMSPGVKGIDDWLNKAKASLAVVVDLSVDEFKPDFGDRIYSEDYLSEAIMAIEHCIRKYEW